MLIPIVIVVAIAIAIAIAIATTTTTATDITTDIATVKATATAIATATPTPTATPTAIAIDIPSIIPGVPQYGLWILNIHRSVRSNILHFSRLGLRVDSRSASYPSPKLGACPQQACLTTPLLLVLVFVAAAGWFPTGAHAHACAHDAGT